jgi:hypothetical protein
MAQHPKAKPKRKSQKNTDKAQSERFIETARKLGSEDTQERFEEAFRKIVSRPKTAS